MTTPNTKSEAAESVDDAVREHLWYSVMEDYVRCAEFGHYAQDQNAHAEEMRGHLDKLCLLVKEMMKTERQQAVAEFAREVDEEAMLEVARKATEDQRAAMTEAAEWERWKTTKAEEHWLEVEDPDGWHDAIVKWDGCVHYTKYSNEPKSEDENDQDYLHICDLQSEIDRLYALLQVARRHYKDHHYYQEAFAKEPKMIAHQRQQAVAEFAREVVAKAYISDDLGGGKAVSENDIVDVAKKYGVTLE